MNLRIALLAVLGLAVPPLAHAQHNHAPPPPAACTPEHAAMGHCTLPAPDATDVPHAGHGATTGCTPEHAAMGHCTLPAPDATDVPHAGHGA
ncbi:MAG: hypothetical protein ACTIJY_05725, partial [Luteimonas sp.]